VTGLDIKNITLDLSGSSAGTVKVEGRLTAELQSLIQLLDSKIPASPQNPRGAALEKQLARDIKRYFEHVEGLIPQEQLTQIYYRHVK